MLVCAHCLAESDATAADPCPACGASLADAEASADPAAEAQAFATRLAAEAQAMADVASRDAEAPRDAATDAAEAQATAARIAAEAAAMARAAAGRDGALHVVVGPQFRLTCRHCGAFVDPSASADCPVCLESTQGAIAVPWTPPSDEKDGEAHPMQVSAPRLPDAVVAAVPVIPAAAVAASKPATRIDEEGPRSSRRETPLRSKPGASRPTPVTPVPVVPPAPDIPTFEVSRPLTASSIVPAVDAPPLLLAPVRAISSGSAPANAVAPATARGLSLGTVVALLLLTSLLSYAAGVATTALLHPLAPPATPSATATATATVSETVTATATATATVSASASATATATPPTEPIIAPVPRLSGPPPGPAGRP